MVLQVPSTLNEPTDEFLVRAPLQLVAFQARFSAPSKPFDIGAGLELQKLLGGEAAWRLEPISTGFKISMPGLQIPELQSGGWRLVDERGAVSIALQADSIGVETNTYLGWPTFFPILTRLVRGFAELLAPQAETRLGLRYINRITHPDVSKAEDWRRWIHRDLVAVLDHPIGVYVAAAQQQLDVHGNFGIRASINHGFFRDLNAGRQTYLLDIDTFREGVRSFDPNNIMATLVTLHHFVLQLFQSSITPELYTYLKGDEK